MVRPSPVHPVRGADHRVAPVAVVREVGELLRAPEVRELHRPVVPDEDVVPLDVPGGPPFPSAGVGVGKGAGRGGRHRWCGGTAGRWGQGCG